MPGKKLNFPEKLATIKSTQNKELLIGLSGVINLLTFTEAKVRPTAGGVGATVTYIADATSVAVTIKCILSREVSAATDIGNVGDGYRYMAYPPGPLTFSPRT